MGIFVAQCMHTRKPKTHPTLIDAKNDPSRQKSDGIVNLANIEEN